jgi:hypothetical protein
LSNEGSTGCALTASVFGLTSQVQLSARWGRANCSTAGSGSNAICTLLPDWGGWSGLAKIDPVEREVKVTFDQWEDVYDFGELDVVARKVIPMKRNGHGHWETTVDLAPGRYEYKFVRDGEWTPDRHDLHPVNSGLPGRVERSGSRETVGPIPRTYPCPSISFRRCQRG